MRNMNCANVPEVRPITRHNLLQKSKCNVYYHYNNDTRHSHNYDLFFP